MLIAAMLVAIAVAGCYEGPAEPIRHINQSDQTIVVYLEGFDDDPYTEIGPSIGYGRAITDGSVCVDPDLVARLGNGSVVDTREGPFCQGDPAWAFTQEMVDEATAP